MKTYFIEYYNNFNELYHISDENSKCEHINSEAYKTKDFETFKTIVKDLLDAPNSKLSYDDVIQDFSSDTYVVSDEKIKSIMTYYNNRFDLLNNIISDITDNNVLDKRYDIDAETNSFNLDDADEYNSQNSAYIHIVITEK